MLYAKPRRQWQWSVRIELLKICLPLLFKYCLLIIYIPCSCCSCVHIIISISNAAESALLEFNIGFSFIYIRLSSHWKYYIRVLFNGYSLAYSYWALILSTVFKILLFFLNAIDCFFIADAYSRFGWNWHKNQKENDLKIKQIIIGIWRKLCYIALLSRNCQGLVVQRKALALVLLDYTFGLRYI